MDKKVKQPWQPPKLTKLDGAAAEMDNYGEQHDGLMPECTSWG